jgi:hypothetical protein
MYSWATKVAPTIIGAELICCKPFNFEGNKLSIIALLTDFGLENNFIGVMKGIIYSINPKVKIVDITHSVNPQDVEEGAFYILTSYRYFPQNTIFVVIVDPKVGGKRRIILIKLQKYYFIAPDNGILSWALKEQKIERIVEVTKEKYFLKPVSKTFHGRDIFAPVAAHLSRGISINEFGKEIKEIINIPFPEPIVKREEIKGKILLIDRFGNAITNLSLKRFSFLKDESFILRIKTAEVMKVCEFYSQGKAEEPFLIPGSSGFWEISISEGNFARQFSIEKGKEFVVTRMAKTIGDIGLMRDKEV